MSDPGLSPAGSSVYSSPTMFVGDGTWDSSKNTFLLPNLQGLNFDTMRYNGMGNRFGNMPSYKAVVTAHGSLAAITFLFVVPAAIFVARFHHRQPRMALKIHIWLQILAVLFSTALVILGFQAVGRKRSLTNPHHGIGVALYTLVMVQAIGGSMIHRWEKGRERLKIPLKLMIHQWLGRLIALLGIAQVALGLTLYGAPRVFFILFALWVFILSIAYFVLSFRHQPRMDFDDRTTYITERTGSTRSRRSKHHGLGAFATAGAAGAGLAAIRQRSRSRSRSRRADSRQEVLSSRRDSRSRVSASQFTDSYISDEKYAANHHKKEGGWKNKLLGTGAAAGGIFAIRSLFGRKDKKHAPTETGSDVSYSRPPLGPSEITQTDLSRLEEGRAPTSPAAQRDHWRRVEEREAAEAAAMAGGPRRHNTRPSQSGISRNSFDSRTSFSDEYDERRQHKSYGLKEGVATLGVLGFLKHSMSKHKNKKEDAHVESLKQQDMEEERIARMNSQRRKYTGDGDAPPRRNNRPPSTILSESDVTGVTPSILRPTKNTTAGPSTGPFRPPPAVGVLSDSGSEAPTSPAGRNHRRRHTAGDTALGDGAAAAAAVSSADHRHRNSSREGSVASPPVSVKVKMHNDGRHVTLRRLNEEEAAAEREARRKERQRRTRAGSVSSLSNMESSRWRRTEAMEAAQAQEMVAQSSGLPPPPPMPSVSGPIRMPEPVIPGPPAGAGSASHIHLPPPPAIPAAANSVLSSPQGTQVYGTETDVSNYDSNRRRRRAERAQAKQARMGGGRVEFQ